MVAMRRVTDWWQSLPLPWRNWRIVGYVCSADEVPEQLPDKGVVLVGAPETLSWAALDCPCRERHRLMVNLDKAWYPFWSIERQKPLSIRPSIADITLGRRCHFVIQNGRVRWSEMSNRLMKNASWEIVSGPAPALRRCWTPVRSKQGPGWPLIGPMAPPVRARHPQPAGTAPGDGDGGGMSLAMRTRLYAARAISAQWALRATPQ